MTFPHDNAQEGADAVFTNIQPYTGEPDIGPGQQITPSPGGAMVRTQTQYTTAVQVQKPRKLNDVVAAVLNEAVYAKEAFYYSFPMGGKKVEGPSIGLAMAVARAWGNCAVPTEYYEDRGEWIFNAHFIDLETGFTVSRVFKKKVGKGLFKKLDDERAEDMTFQAAQSRAIRNVVAAGVPRWLITQAIDKAKEAVLKGITHEGVAHATESALKYLAGYGVAQDQVEAVMGKKAEQWDAEDLATLRGMASQLKDGQATAAQLFPPVSGEAAKQEKAAGDQAAAKKLSDEAMAAGKAKDQADKKAAALAKKAEPPEDLNIDPSHLQHSKTLGTTVVEPGPLMDNPNAGAEQPPEMKPSEFEQQRLECWKLVISRGIDLNEMDRFTGVSRIEHITPDNLKNVLPYVQQWTPSGKGGRKK